MRKLTITVDEDVYNGLHATIGRGRISSFLNDLAKPYVVDVLDSGYVAMAQDEAREAEALSWSESLLSDDLINNIKQ